jgi:hypothetical protein
MTARLTPHADGTLGGYVLALIDRLGAVSPVALARLRALVGERRARLTLGAETVELRFVGSRLTVAPGAGGAVDGIGLTDRATTFDLLDGRREVYEAILDGSLHAVGEVDAVVALFRAVEILLDQSTRDPGLQALARDYRASAPPPAPSRRPSTVGGTRRSALRHASDAELGLLARLDLLP